MSSEERDQDRLELMIELIGHIQRRLSGKTQAAFFADQDEIDLTSFRLLHIGEAANKLSPSLKSRHPATPWPEIYRMRNVISHEYFGIDSSLVWLVATTRLDQLLDLCRTELARFPE